MEPLILLCAATSIEASACQKAVTSFRLNRRFEILKTGIGQTNALKALNARLMNKSLSTPVLVISTGFAGSLSPRLSIGSWVMGESVVDLGMSEAIVLSKARFSLTFPSSIPVQLARVVTLEKATSQKSSAFKSLQAQQTDSPPTVIDMESYALAELCQAHGIPFSIVRLISDNPDHPLPEAIGSFASAWTEKAPQVRLRHLAQGLTQAASKPQALAQFIARSSKLPRLLTRGWQEILSS